MAENAVLITAISSILVVSITSLVTLVINKRSHKQSIKKELYSRKVNIYEESVASRELIIETIESIYTTLRAMLCVSTEEEIFTLEKPLQPLSARFQKEYEDSRSIVNKSLLYLDGKIDDGDIAIEVYRLISNLSQKLTEYHSAPYTQVTPGEAGQLRDEIEADLKAFLNAITKIKELNHDQIKKFRNDLKRYE
jgi:hypothetical protein